MTSERELDDAFKKRARVPGDMEKNFKLFIKSNKLTSSTSTIAVTSDLSTIQEQKIDDGKSAVINASDETKETDEIVVEDQKVDCVDNVEVMTISKVNEKESNDSKVASKPKYVGHDANTGIEVEDSGLNNDNLKGTAASAVAASTIVASKVAASAVAANPDSESFAEELKPSLLTKEELMESLLTVREGEKIDTHGWVLRKFDASYNDLVPNDLKNAKKTEQLDHVIKSFRDFNESKYARSVFDYSTSPFETIKPELASSLRDLFFNDKDELNFMVTQHFTDVEDKDYGIHPTHISFEKTKVIDQRIQISFNKGSMMEKTVQSKLIEHGLIDSTLEFVEDVSLIIGGTNIQDFHQDIPRANSYFKDGKKQIIGWELNRSKYNDVVSGKNAPCSILVDLSIDKSGIYLTLPSESVVKVDKDNVHVIFEKDNTVFEGKTIREGEGNNGRETCTIKVNSGCRFVGDFFHAGADNLQKLKSRDDFTIFFEKYKSALGKNKKDLLNVLKSYSEISKITRMFLKIIPRNYSTYIPRESIYFSEHNHYDNKYVDKRNPTTHKRKADSLVTSTPKEKSISSPSQKKNKNAAPWLTPNTNRELDSDLKAEVRRSARNTPMKPSALSVPAIASVSLEPASQQKKPRGKKFVKKNELLSSSPKQEPTKKSKEKKESKKPPPKSVGQEKKTSKKKSDKYTKSSSSSSEEELIKESKRKKSKESSQPSKKNSDEEASAPQKKSNDKPVATCERFKKFAPQKYSKQSKVTEDDVFFDATMDPQRPLVISNNKTQKKQENDRMKKQLSRASITLRQIESYFEDNNTHVTVTDVNLLCDQYALAVYINEEEYTKTMKNVDDADNFEIEVKHLWDAKLKHCIHLAQKGWLLDKTRETNYSRRFFALTNEYAYDLDFPEWRLPNVDPLKIPMASWFAVKVSTIDTSDLGVFALRAFVSGELIAFFYGHRHNKETPPTKWALETRFGIYDPLRGLIGSGREAPYMAMHLVKQSNEDSMINATISEKFLVHATKDIQAGDEISFILNSEIWRPKITLSEETDVNNITE